LLDSLLQEIFIDRVFLFILRTVKEY